MSVAVKTYKPLTIYQPRLVINERQYDPTRTTTLRNRFATEMRKRFRELRGQIREAVVDKDVFGMQSPVTQAPGRKAFDFPRSQDKINGFMTWLRNEMDRGVLEIRQMQQAGEAVEKAWTNTYIKDSYQRGVIRARQEMKNAGFNIPSIEESGGINTAMGTPFHADRLGVLYTRAFRELKGITDAMDQNISRVLTQGMADGDNPRLLARKMNQVIKKTGADLGLTDTLGRYVPAERRAEMMARTEIIRAHHQATIQEYRNWGAEGVKVKAEWRTAGDNRVCERCLTMEMSGPYTLNEIEGQIPLHPQCRCIALPMKVDKNKIR